MKSMRNEFHKNSEEISQNSMENTCARVSFCFPMNFEKFLRIPLVAASEN